MGGVPGYVVLGVLAMSTLGPLLLIGFLEWLDHLERKGGE